MAKSGAGRSMVVTFEARTDALRRQVAGAETIMSRFGKTTSRVGSGMKAAFASVGGIVAGVSGVGAAATAAAKSAMDFEAQVSKVRATGAATAPQLKALEAQSMSMAKTFGVSGTEAMNSVEALAKAGVSTADIMSGGLKGALSLAAAGEMDVGDAAETASSAMAQFNLKGKDVGHIADVLAQGANLAQGTVSDLSQALSQGGMVASQMGMSLDETVGVLAEFANKGLMGSDAGTSLKTMLQRLSNPAADAQKTMQKLGIAAYDAQGKFVGLSSFAGQLQTSMKHMTDQQRNAAMSTIFGADAVRAAGILYADGAKGVADWAKNVGKSGAAMETARTNTDNLKGDLDKAKASFQNAFITLGESSQGPLRSVVQGLTSVATAAPAAAKTMQDAASVFVGWWTGRGTDVETSWSEPLGEVAAQLRGIWDSVSSKATPQLAAMGTAVKGAFSGAASLLKGVWDVIAPLLGDVVKLAGATALGALILAWQTLKVALDAISPVLSAVGGFLSDHKTIVGGLATSIGVAVLAYKGFAIVTGIAKSITTLSLALRFAAMYTKVWAAAQKVWNLVMSLNPIGLIIAGVVALVAAFIYAYRHSETFRNIVNGALHGVMVAARAVAGWFAGPFVGFFKAGWDGVTAGASAVGSFFSGIWNGLKAGASAIGTFFSTTVPGFFTAAWGVIRGAFMAGVTAITAVLTVLWNAISNTWAFRALQSIVITVIAIVRWTIVSFVTGVKIIWGAFWNGLVAVARSVWNTIRAIVAAGTAAVRAVIVPVINGIRAVWSVVWGAISAFFRSVWNSIYRFVAIKILQVQMVIVRVMNIIRALWSVAWGAVSGTASRVWNGIAGTTSRVFTSIRNRISSIMGAISGIWSRGWNGVRNVGARLMGSVQSTFSRILGSIKNAFSNTVSAIGKIFGGLKKVIGSPISWVVDHVLNKGIIGAIRTVQKFFNVDEKNRMPTLTVPKFRQGGQAPTGYVDAPFSSANRDNLLAFTAAGMPFRYEGGEFITKRESTARSMGLLTAINDGQIDDRIAGFKGGGRLTGGGSGRWTPRFEQTMLNAANILSGTIQIIKKGFLPAGGISGSSHVGDAVDASGADLWAVRDAMRKAGVAAWVRGPKQGFSWHIHGVPQSSAYGSAGGSGIYQQGAYQRHADGLHSYESDIYATRDGKNAGGHWYSGIVSFAERMADKAKSAFGGLASPVDFLKSKITGLKDSVTGALGGSGWAGTLAKIPAKLWESASSWVSSKWKSFLAAGDAAEGTAGGVSGVIESFRGLVRQALSITGIGSGKSDEDKWLRQVKSESNGNPNLIQSSALRDINVRRGDPARGLVQVPGVTWADFGKDQGPFLSNWMNPLKNLIVGMRAAFAQHGGAAWRRAIGKGRGYGSGTRSAVPGWAWVGEYGPELMRMSGGEQILTATESAGLQRRSSHVAVADTSGAGPLLSEAQWDELLEAIREGGSPAIVDGKSLKEALRSEVTRQARIDRKKALR